MTIIDYSLSYEKANVGCPFLRYSEYLDSVFILAFVSFIATLNKENSLKKFSFFSDWLLKIAIYLCRKKHYQSMSERTVVTKLGEQGDSGRLTGTTSNVYVAILLTVLQFIYLYFYSNFLLFFQRVIVFPFNH